MRFQPVHALQALAVSALGLTLMTASAHADPKPGVTDLTAAKATSIETQDIIEALAVTRGTRIDTSAPPTVRLPVYFEFDSNRLTPDAVTLLEKVGAALSAEELENFRFSVEGHTDSVGPAQYNSGLSARRAGAVASFLTETGVPSERLGTVGRGEGDPVASNDDDTGRQRNRRVELINLGAQP